MKKTIYQIIEKLEKNWNKRQGLFWRLRNNFTYNFMQKMFEKNVPQIIPDPSIDDENEIYSFFVKPNMQLGLPGEEYATRVDYDGQLDTAIGKYGGGKFLFFLGDNIEPVQRRIWTLS
ncbi:MAG: hypothetical protein ACTSQG_04195, partial [Promethearchaeota archaeon]